MVDDMSLKVMTEDFSWCGVRHFHPVSAMPLPQGYRCGYQLEHHLASLLLLLSLGLYPVIHKHIS